MTLMDQVLTPLTGPGLPVVHAMPAVPAAPGLYAVHAAGEVWEQLGLGAPPDDRPLYVGKAEDSLASRDVKTHFSTGRTGASTLRRTLAALLVENLDLRAQPRNVETPNHFSNYGLENDGDRRLTHWMLEHLTLAVWPTSAATDLVDLETQVLDRLRPPLNLSKVTTPWRQQVRAARKRMADRAKQWSPS